MKEMETSKVAKLIATGITREVDEIGRVVIPKSLRDTILNYERVSIELIDEYIVVSSPTFNKLTRKKDELGRIVIPKSIRKKLNIKEKEGYKQGTMMEIYTAESAVYLKKYENGCYCCGKVGQHLTEVLGRKLCPKCLNQHKQFVNTIKVSKWK